jgi:hypothetical protein
LEPKVFGAVSVAGPLVVKELGDEFDALRRRFGESSGLLRYFSSKDGGSLSLHGMVPAGISPERAADFEQGFGGDQRQSRMWLNEHLIRLASQNDSGSFIVQDIGLSVDIRRSFLSAIAPQYFGYQNSAYYWLNHKQFSLQKLDLTLNVVRSFPLIAAYCALDLFQGYFRNGQEVSHEQFSALTVELKEFYLSAYDDESFVVARFM